VDDAGTPVPEAVERLKLEIERLSRELHKSLEDAVYLRMTESELHVYEEKCKELKRLTQELAQLIQRQHPKDRA
jgi:predicted RNase H-like nuclease (RuvC/YqgF family)